MSEENKDPRSYPALPLLAASAAVFRDGLVLVARRAKPPLAGVWSLPGGLVEIGETLAEAAAREVAEETGVTAEPVAPAGYVDVIRRDEVGAVARHFVVVSFAARWIAGKGEPIEDTDAVRWVSPEALSELELTEGTADIVARALAVLD